jgi:hypothetical protein
MSFDGSVDLVWAGDERKFRLGIAELLSLQVKRDSGPYEILVRLQTGMWRVEDLQETIRIGLIGAGVDGGAARKLVDENVREGRLTANVLIAQAILLNALAGDPEEPVGKEGRRRKRRGAKDSPSPPSTETAQ